MAKKTQTKRTEASAKKEEVKAPVTPEPKKEEIKIEEPKKEEPKKEEPKKEEPKKEEPKKEEPEKVVYKSDRAAITNSISYLKTRNVKDIERGTGASAGIDFFIPDESADFIADLTKANTVLGPLKFFIIFDRTEKKNYIELQPHGSILIPSGIKVLIEPRDSALIFQEKSGVATKKKLSVGAKVVDSDYLGEVHIHLFNESDTKIKLQFGEKIAQAVHVPVILSDVYPVLTEEEYINKSQSKNSERGEGGFGSTGI